MFVFNFGFLMIGLLYTAHTHGNYIPVKAKVLPCEGASALALRSWHPSPGCFWHPQAVLGIPRLSLASLGCSWHP